MFDKFGRGLLIFILTIAVMLGAYLGYSRYFIEMQSRGIELCVDFNDLKMLAANEQKPLDLILAEVKKSGLVSLGVFEQTLPEANAEGEVYCAKGEGILNLAMAGSPFSGLIEKELVKKEKTYIYAPGSNDRKRIYNHLKLVLGKNRINFLGGAVLEVDAIAEELREIGLGISEAQKAYLSSFGFKIIPRVWQEARLTAENIGAKVSALSDFETIIFDGEEILGYPADLEQVSAAMKKNKISYGYIEIVKQEGDSRLKKLMARDVVRVHSVPQKELKKISQGEAVKRFVRAAKERGVSLIYLRPFQPAQCGGPPIVYNLEYFTLVKESLEKSGFIIGQSEKVYPLMVAPWQLLLLAAGVLTGALLLLGYFLALPLALTYLLLLLSMVGTYFMINAGYITLVQKSLALLTTITFPTLAVISNLSKKAKVIFSIFDPITIILNIVGETMIGLFLLLGILADYRFMLGVETFAGVKFALLLPMVLVAVYFLLKSVRGNLIDHIKLIMAAKVSAAIVVSSLVFLGALFVLLARSGNFVLPVPAIEKYFREFLETAMFIRPRTKEFLIGYPALFIAAISFLRGRTQWLWLLAAAGTIAPISMINSFSHVHTPIMVSIARSINGLILGVIFGLIIGLLVDRLIMKSFWKTK